VIETLLTDEEGSYVAPLHFFGSGGWIRTNDLPFISNVSTGIGNIPSLLQPLKR